MTPILLMQLMMQEAKNLDSTSCGCNGSQPFVRFLGYHNMETNQHYWQQWISKINQWVLEGKQPFFMMHTAGNGRAYVRPEFNQMLVDQHPDINGMVKEEGACKRIRAIWFRF